jgi:hypothetical protein
MRKLLKFLHTTGAIAFTGGLGTFMLVLAAGPDIASVDAYAALRHSLEVVSAWIIVPSMGLVTVSGLLAMGVHFPFQNAPWVWIKALSGVLIFEATLASVDAPAERAATAAARAAAGEIDIAELTALVQDKWVAWWVLLALAAINVVFAIWRPRFGRKPGD